MQRAKSEMGHEATIKYCKPELRSEGEGKGGGRRVKRRRSVLQIKSSSSPVVLLLPFLLFFFLFFHEMVRGLGGRWGGKKEGERNAQITTDFFPPDKVRTSHL